MIKIGFYLRRKAGTSGRSAARCRERKSHVTMKNYRILDAHCDTLTTLKETDRLLDAPRNFNLRQAGEYESFTQVMALWVDVARDGDRIAERTEKYIRRFYQELAANPAVRQIRNASDLTEEGGTRVLLAVEGGEAAGRSLEGVRALFRQGVRLMTLTWNTPYAISDTCMATAEKLNGEEDYRGGLTRFGKSVVREMNRLGMMVDVSHLSDRGFYDVAEIAEKPFIASHSNARALCPHVRNLTDDMFRILKEKGGVTGINFCPAFLRESGRADLSDILRHIEYFMALGGQKNVGLGSDFDGIDTTPEGVSATEHLYKIADALLTLNYPQSLVEDILHGNMERVFRAVLPPSGT